jgi:Rad3-related DNA helicase
MSTDPNMPLFITCPSFHSPSYTPDLTHSVVIFDEAHNIEDVCRDSASMELTQQSMAEVEQECAFVCMLFYYESGQAASTQRTQLCPLDIHWQMLYFVYTQIPPTL